MGVAFDLRKRPQGLKPDSFVRPHAALKGRSSTSHVTLKGCSFSVLMRPGEAR